MAQYWETLYLRLYFYWQEFKSIHNQFALHLALLINLIFCHFNIVIVIFRQYFCCSSLVGEVLHLFLSLVLILNICLLFYQKSLPNLFFLLFFRLEFILILLHFLLSILKYRSYFQYYLSLYFLLNNHLHVNLSFCFCQFS